MQPIREREAFSRRLREALARVGDDGSSPSRLAKEFNKRYPGDPITLHASRKWLQGEAMPAQDKVRVLAKWLGVTTEWLRYGDGSSKAGAAEKTPAIDYELAREVAALTPANQAVVKALVKALRKAESA